MLSRERSIFAAICLAAVCAGALGAAWAEAQAAERKFEAIQEGRLRPGTSVRLTAGELNSWVRMKARVYVPRGLRNPRLEFGSGRVTGSAQIDFLKLRQAATGEAPGWIAKNLFAGERPVSVTARVESNGGRARVDVESVEISGVRIQGEVLDFLIRNYVLPEFPAARIGAWFPLAPGIDRFTIGPSGVSVYIGGARRVAALQLREPGVSERPASGCTTLPPQMATPVRISACRKLFSMA